MDVPVSQRLIKGSGTNEAIWTRSGALDHLQTMALSGLLQQRQRLVVIAPHPDDEVLGAGGLLAMAAAEDIEALVVSVTDGEKSHPDADASVIRYLRQGERERALRHLGVDPGCVRQLSIPDGAVTQHEALLEAELGDLLRAGDLVVCPWDEDGHPDHEASARASQKAARVAGATLLEYPVWGWHWCTPERFPFERAVRLQLDWEAVAAKTHALGLFSSQIAPRPEGPVLSPETLAHFRRPFEIFLR